MSEDLWEREFVRRAAPQLRKLLQSDDDLPELLVERLARLRQSEDDKAKRAAEKTDG